MRFSVIILFLLMLVMSVPAFAASSPVAKVSLIKNKVQVKPSADTVWHDAKTGEELYENDQIKTTKDSMVEITFINTGSKIRLKDLSQVTIDGQSNDVKLSFGKLFMAVSKGKGGMKVKAPVAVAAVLGTVGVIEYDPIGNTYSVTSIDGTFAVTDTSGNTTNLNVGNIISITPTGGVVLNTADILNVIQANSNALPPEFIQIGLSLDQIKTDTAGNTIIELSTANPKEKIQINTTSGEMNIIQIDTTIINNNTNNTNMGGGNDQQPPSSTSPATNITNTVTNVTNTTTIIPTLPPATTVTVPIN